MKCHISLIASILLLSACGGGGLSPTIAPASSPAALEPEQVPQLLRIETGPDGTKTAFILMTPGLSAYGHREFQDRPGEGLDNIHLGLIGENAWRATLTFELPELPSDVRILSARLHVVAQILNGTTRDPFDPITGIGRVVVDHVDARPSLFTSRDVALYDLPPLEAPIGGIHNPDVLVDQFDRSTDVTKQVERDVANGRGMSQFRFRHENDHLSGRLGRVAFNVLEGSDHPLILELKYGTFTVDAPSPQSERSPVRPVVGGLAGR